MQWNCNGIGNKVTELAAYLHSTDVKIAALQETKLGPKSKPPNLGSQYTLIRQDRPGGRQGGGLAFLIHQSVLFTRVEPANANDGTMEAMAIKVKFNNNSSISTSHRKAAAQTTTPRLSNRSCSLTGLSLAMATTDPSTQASWTPEGSLWRQKLPTPTSASSIQTPPHASPATRRPLFLTYFWPPMSSSFLQACGPRQR